METATVRFLQDETHPHLVQPQCECGWNMSGFVTKTVATYQATQHEAAHRREDR